jgi:hypothetical protein
MIETLRLRSSEAVSMMASRVRLAASPSCKIHSRKHRWQGVSDVNSLTVYCSIPDANLQVDEKHGIDGEVAPSTAVLKCQVLHLQAHPSIHLSHNINTTRAA